jgi:hypothetical protein
MQHKPTLFRILRPAKFLFLLAAPIFLMLLANSCKMGDRTTVIYGKVTDQNNEPVDSILVTASGLWYLNIEVVKEIYTDENGDYELVIEAAKKYTALDIVIPYVPVENPKFQWNYDVDKVFKNDVRTNNCCMASIGGKTKWDFQLKPKKY